MSLYQASIDRIMQSVVVGWAVCDGRPTTLTLSADDWSVQAPANMSRPDLAAAGLPAEAGFTVTLPQPLTIDNELTVAFPDGSFVAGSPFSGHRSRLRELLDGVDPNDLGLEFGPLDRPVLGKRKANVKYVDHASRDELLAKYTRTGSTETINSDRVAEVDIIWPGGSLAACVPTGHLYQYAIASHVIEHVPDMIGWLQEIAAVLKMGGLLNLAIPDKHETFDWPRRTTSISAFIAAHVEGRKRPSAQQIFDHISITSPLGIAATPKFYEAFQICRDIEGSQEYLDVHCQVFTANSFLTVMGQIASIGLLPFRLRKAYATRMGANEFIVSLEKSNLPSEMLAASFQAATSGF